MSCGSTATLRPPEWGIPISEFAHALRTALDNLLWQLILARGGTPVPKVTQFPINEEEADFNGKPKRRPRPGEPAWRTEGDRLTHGISTVDRAFIEAAQPFKARANVAYPAWANNAARAHPLAMLADLTNIDKHRYIHVAYAAAALPHAKEGAAGIVRFRDMSVVVGSPDRPLKVVPVLIGSPQIGQIDPALMVSHWPILRYRSNGEIITPNVGPGPNDDPTEIVRVPARDVPDAEVYVDPPLELEISLSDRERPMTIFDFGDILEQVSGIVERFRCVVV